MSASADSGSLRSFDRVAGVYDATRSAPPQVARALTAALLDVLQGVSQQPRVLEVGIGTGRIAVPLAEAGTRITGIDISPKMLNVLRLKRSDIDVMLAEAAHQPFSDASFDTALFVHILHLVPDIEGTLRESMRVVRARGALVRVSDDHDEGGYHLEAGRVTWDVVEDFTSVKRPREQHAHAAAVFESTMRDAGAEVDTRVVARYDMPFSARRAMDHLRRRDFSSDWAIPEAALDDVAAALERRFEELWGDLDADHPAEKTVRLAVARLR